MTKKDLFLDLAKPDIFRRIINGYFRLSSFTTHTISSVVDSSLL